MMKAPKTVWYRLLWAYLFRGLNGKLYRHWLRSLTEVEGEELPLFGTTYSNWLEEKARRKEHIRQMNLPKLNYNRTKYQNIF